MNVKYSLIKGLKYTVGIFVAEMVLVILGILTLIDKESAGCDDCIRLPFWLPLTFPIVVGVFVFLTSLLSSLDSE